MEIRHLLISLYLPAILDTIICIFLVTVYIQNVTREVWRRKLWKIHQFDVFTAPWQITFWQIFGSLHIHERELELERDGKKDANVSRSWVLGWRRETRRKEKWCVR